MGKRAVYGFNVMTNTGQSPITNLTATLVSDGTPAAGVTFEQPVVVDIRKHDIGYLGSGEWPFERWGELAVPLAGTAIAPDADGRIELLVVLRVDAAGQWFWPRTRIEYDYAGNHYVKEVTNGFALCAPAPCNAPRPKID